MLRFEDQQLTSFGDLLVFQQLFNRLQQKQLLKACFAHMKLSPIFGRHLVVLLLILHLLLGFRRLREVDYYRDNPIVLRMMGLRRLPDVATICRALGQMEAHRVENVRQLSRSIVNEPLQRVQLPRVTLDFDGSVQSTGNSSTFRVVVIRDRFGVFIWCYGVRSSFAISRDVVITSYFKLD